MKYNLKTLTKPDNAEKLKELGRLENLDELEKIFDTDVELSKYIRDSGLELIGRCGKMTYIAMLTSDNWEMSASQVRDLINKVFSKNWSTKAVRSYLGRLTITKLVSARYGVFKSSYRICNKSELGHNATSEITNVARAKVEMRKESVKKRLEYKK